MSWVCDSDNDCGDMSDEVNCPKRNCSAGEMSCANGHCIPLDWRCDGHDDCNDGSDERCPIHECRADQLLCPEGLCFSLDRKCDGVKHCSDGSDEMDCGKCQKGEFKCNSGICINIGWHCDGDADCDDRSDELNCSLQACGNDEFRCQSGFCISKSLRCNGNQDCSDNSDEKGCWPETCRQDQYACDAGKCLALYKVCNGQTECQDGADEINCNFLGTCSENNGWCHHNCRDTSNGPRCWCRPGYSLHRDKKSCQDVDECGFEGTCSQICHNTEGSYRCACVPGYQLKPDGRGCKAQGGEAYLIFANRVDILRVTPDKAEFTSILQGLQDAISLDFHHHQSLVFWSDVTLDVIKRAHLNGSDVREIVSYGLENTGGLAVDWIHNKLFWTDAGTSRIEVANLDGTHRTVILWQNLQKPRAIAAHPGKGLIFWTDWGTTPRIERASMDGGMRLILANTSLFWPNGLTLDYAAERIYWADAKHHVIESSNLEGSQRRTVINKGLPHPFALTIFEDELYWTDWLTKSINKANKFSGSRVETIRSNLFFPMDIHTMHPQRQPWAESKCKPDNGGCSHLCLPNESSYSCVCPTGLVLGQDKKTCTVLDKFILFSTQNNLRRISLDVPEVIDVIVPLSGVESAVGVDFDSTTDSIFWSDIIADNIGRASWDGKDETVLVGTSLDSPAGLALDWAGRNLYWTDSGNDRIEMCALDTNLRTVIVWRDLDYPRDIVVHPMQGLMFWTDLGKSAVIERAGLDGSRREIIVNHNITFPNGLALDFSTDRLYWVDGGTRAIESSALDGSKRRVIIATGPIHPFGVTVFDSLVYWTDWGTRSIHYADKDIGSGQGRFNLNFGNILDLKIFHRHRPAVSTPCSKNNGGCSHICLLAPPPRGHACACPTGIVMKPNGVDCQTEMRNFLIFTRGKDIRKISLEVEYYMDVVIPLGEVRNAIAVDVDVLEAHLRSRGIGPSGQVSNLDGSMRAVLLYKDLDKPRAIALHYDKGFMFWTDWGKRARIERADMDGKNRKVLISEDIVWPNGLTIDRQMDRIIWADAKTERIECADLSGKFRRGLVTRVQHPYGLTVAGSSIFWTDWRQRSIYQANKNMASNITQLRGNLKGVMDIHAVQIEGVETHVNRCGKNNGGCSHLCLPNPRGTSCACPTGLLMMEDGRTCNEVPSKYLLFAARGNIGRISLDTPDHTDVFLPIPDLHNVIALDFDYRDNMVYYTDVHLDVVRRAYLNGSMWTEDIILKELSTTDGLAIDWIARNLYWTDAGRDVIEVSRLDGSSRKKIIKRDLFEPRAITLYPKKGLMFWTDWGKKPRIERAYLDGTARKVIIDKELGYPNGLTIDYLAAPRLYWVDAKLDKIETADLAGRDRRTLVQRIPHPFGLTVFEDWIYWTDWQTERLEKAHKKDGSGRKTVQSRIEGLMDVHMVAAERQTGSNNCSSDNGGCSHLCLARPGGYVCACPDTPDATPCKTSVCDDSRAGYNIQEAADETEASPGPYIALAVVLGVLLVILILAFFIWKRHRRRHYNVEEFATLTYANPTYQKASTETINSDNRFGRMHFRYHASDERLTAASAGSDSTDSSQHEAASLFQPSAQGGADRSRLMPRFATDFKTKWSPESEEPEWAGTAGVYRPVIT
ncbi:low-density lipoprotein receptor-related protein 4 [Plakobranchus ocellatus]|uniref:Low-density lipoprotein receptor-related protein 4 n=1 Tax=Plakobranchus ocellatus TaxID=259542 RepID=A0AAV4CTN9_9GAST|nr:low-density lipoprotein receptor-related protein 4 [Plakobranchus ocellatus]